MHNVHVHGPGSVMCDWKLKYFALKKKYKKIKGNSADTYRDVTVTVLGGAWLLFLSLRLLIFSTYRTSRVFPKCMSI